MKEACCSLLRTMKAAVASLMLMGYGALSCAAPSVTAVGNPTFVPTDFHLFAAPVGTASTGYAEYLDTLQALLPPPGHGFDPAIGVTPGAPHAGPYDTELARGVAANGFAESSVFTTQQYSNGTGVYLVYMLVAGGASPTGSSPDFASGPVIPNSAFPLTIDGATFVDGMLDDVLTQFQLPATAGVDGQSHIPFFFIDNMDFATLPIVGSYEYRISVLDAGGNGYEIVAPFQVVPEPPFGMLLATVAFAATFAARGRPKAAGGIRFA